MPRQGDQLRRRCTNNAKQLNRSPELVQTSLDSKLSILNFDVLIIVRILLIHEALERLAHLSFRL